MPDSSTAAADGSDVEALMDRAMERSRQGGTAPEQNEGSDRLPGAREASDQAANRGQKDEKESVGRGPFRWLRQALGLGASGASGGEELAERGAGGEEPLLGEDPGDAEAAPPHVRETFQRIFEMTRRALGAREEDFALGNVSQERQREGVRLRYRWRENSEETARCSCGGKSLSVERQESAWGAVRYTIRKHIRAERDGTDISASDDRENDQVSEADCRAALDVFAASCEAVAPHRVGSAASEEEPGGARSRGGTADQS